jgi:hypothetical protein
MSKESAGSDEWFRSADWDDEARAGFEAPPTYAHRFALALPDMDAVAHPTGVGRAISTYTIPIEGRDEWLAAAELLAVPSRRRR